MLIKFKYLFQERKELTLDTKKYPLLSVTRTKGITTQLQKIPKTRVPVARKIIYPNDIALSSKSWGDGNYVSSISSVTGSIATMYFILYPLSNNIDISYFGYLFQELSFKTIF